MSGTLKIYEDDWHDWHMFPPEEAGNTDNLGVSAVAGKRKGPVASGDNTEDDVDDDQMRPYPKQAQFRQKRLVVRDNDDSSSGSDMSEEEFLALQGPEIAPHRGANPDLADNFALVFTVATDLL